jgi:hypothetical protein
MFKALRRAAWGLAAGLALTSPALAQYAAHFPGQNAPVVPRVGSLASPTTPSGYVVPVNSAGPTLASTNYYAAQASKAYTLQPVSHMATVTTITGMPTGYVLQAVDGQPVTEPVMDSHTKLEEMKVELALLADPATFGCNLSAKLENQAMLVRGFVPNERVRQHAIEIARTGTHLTIADGLKIHRTLAMRTAGVPVDVLEKGAKEMLTEDFPEIASGIEIKATITGQITISGSARSVEEKLSVSQRLRRLTGCTCVLNQLKITPIVKDGASVAMVTADGLHVVPPELTMDVPIPSATVTVPAMPIGVSSQGASIIQTIPSAAAAPSSPTVMEASPATRTLPSALPTGRPSKVSTLPAPASGVSQGVVTFGDETDGKPQGKKWK